MVLGNYFYIFGCNNDPNGVQRASINTDGSLEPFSRISDITLVERTFGYATAVVGPYLYILGGAGKDIERSTIGVDGTLGPFELVSTTALTVSRLGPAASIIGNYLYVFGGNIGTGTTASIERALINPDSSLGTFVHFADSVATAYTFLTTSIVGYDIYVFYGSDMNAQPQNMVQRAQIDVNGSLGVFEVATDITVDVQNSIGASLGPGTMMIGGYLYALGRQPDVERARITTTGVPALGPFTAVPDVTVMPSRFIEAIAVIGNYAYLVGGTSGRVILSSVSRAELK